MVILGSLPPNERVQNQIFGRAARCGQPGSGFMILQKSEIANMLGESIIPDGMIPTGWMVERQKKVEKQLSKFKLEQLPAVKLRGDLFYFIH